jgi:pyrroloquinoline quinone biosynthesis protein B
MSLGNQVLCLVAIIAFAAVSSTSAAAQNRQHPEAPFVTVLGVAQDGGFPQMGCKKACCQSVLATEHPRLVSCIALVDPKTNQRWIFDATPDLPAQLRKLDAVFPVPQSNSQNPGLAGVFLTHAHIGHYPGLMYFGRETMGAAAVPVFAMARMAKFLQESGPWSQLVSLKNIELRPLQAEQRVELAERLDVFALAVPHRDEYSETVGYVIEGPGRRVLYLPDIDKFERWGQSIEEVLKRVDRAYVDGTFYDAAELPGRDMSEIPHPFMVETMEQLGSLPANERSKIHFIHLNHTNPVLDLGSDAAHDVARQGFFVARTGDIFELF